MRVRGRWLGWLLVLAVGCAVNPATGRRQFLLVSEAEEIQIGRANDAEIVRQFGVLEDAEVVGWVEQVGGRLAAASERPGLPWTFRVLDDPVVNAFALPGGFVYLTRGILAYANSEAEVAGVLGHEIGHITARHAAERMTTASLAQLGIGLGSVLSPSVRRAGDLLQTGVGLLLLKFSRDDESEADALGVRYAVGGGYDARRLADFFDTVGGLSARSGSRLPDWLSTHPAPEQRRVRVLEAAETLAAAHAGALRVGHDEHLRRVDGLVFGQDPRQGVFVGTTFKHPALLFQVDFPDAWQTDNARTAVVARDPDGQGVLLLTLEQAEGTLAEQARARATAQRLEVLEAGWTRVAGLPAYRSLFAAESAGEGPLLGSDLLVAYAGRVYSLTGVAREAAWPRLRAGVERWQNSFRRLPAEEAARYRPARVHVVRAAATGPLRRLHDGKLSLEEFALLNGLGPDERVQAGRLLKTVVEE